jgi:hypothetical protein
MQEDNTEKRARISIPCNIFLPSNHKSTQMRTFIFIRLLNNIEKFKSFVSKKALRNGLKEEALAAKVRRRSIQGWVFGYKVNNE